MRLRRMTPGQKDKVGPDKKSKRKEKALKRKEIEEEK